MISFLYRINTCHHLEVIRESFRVFISQEKAKNLVEKENSRNPTNELLEECEADPRDPSKHRVRDRHTQTNERDGGRASAPNRPQRQEETRKGRDGRKSLGLSHKRPSPKPPPHSERL
ncbi:hypothetical protein JRQ81_010316 [Phrynocephalus forsythii]|uniref:Uncharacterized protein n=1 Tax=Phrynocephalus forsythii TaxID=171643 RepID=A0A9Q1ARS0_9SAUR|nr:hypothetical protein JRQ81_010316 [Phrynocephalus forsythii]